MLRGFTPGLVEIQLCLPTFDMYDNMHDLVYVQPELEIAFLCNFTAWF